MKRDHRPYFVKRLYMGFERWYADHFLRPQFEKMGEGALFFKPWHVEVFGGPVVLGRYTNVIATPDRKVRFTVWSTFAGGGRIVIGDYALVCPGVRISAATDIFIGHSCMLAHGAFVTDADWHGLYDRSESVGRTEPVRIGDNVWIGDGAIVCKGVTIGDNSIVGAGSVVVRDIPPNTVAAGNPAVVTKELDRNRPVRTRAQWLADPGALREQFAQIDRAFLKDNTVPGWLRSLLFPRKGD